MRSALEKYNSLNEAKRIIVREVESMETEFMCFSCDHFNPKDGFCVQWNAEPPEEAQRQGCDKHDNIPF